MLRLHRRDRSSILRRSTIFVGVNVKEIMSQEFNYKQNELVNFDMGVLSGRGKVVGCSTTPQFLIGATYIVEVHECTPPLPNDAYPFDTIVVPEIHLEHTN